jgi:hypothetical protein
MGMVYSLIYKTKGGRYGNTDFSKAAQAVLQLQYATQERFTYF